MEALFSGMFVFMVVLDYATYFAVGSCLIEDSQYTLIYAFIQILIVRPTVHIGFVILVGEII